jgi:hypothetical protein
MPLLLLKTGLISESNLYEMLRPLLGYPKPFLSTECKYKIKSRRLPIIFLHKASERFFCYELFYTLKVE